MPKAILLQNPRSPVTFDPQPQTPESIRAAWEACNAERAIINAQTGVNLPLLPIPPSLGDAA